MSTSLARIADAPPAQIDVMQLGQVLSKSGYFADAKDAAQAVVKVLAGQELGIGPVAAMTGIFIVKGRVTMSANLIAAQIKRSGRYNYRVLRLDDSGCEIAFFEGGQEIGRSSFTEADAKSASLWGSSDPWKKTPRNMLFARAISNGAKWYCPDIFAGPVYTPDELNGPAVVDELPPAPAANPITGEVVEGAAFDPEREAALNEMRAAARRAKKAGADIALPDKAAVGVMSLDEIRNWTSVYKAAAEEQQEAAPAAA